MIKELEKERDNNIEEHELMIWVADTAPGGGRCADYIFLECRKCKWKVIPDPINTGANCQTGNSETNPDYPKICPIAHRMNNQISDRIQEIQLLIIQFNHK